MAYRGVQFKGGGGAIVNICHPFYNGPCSARTLPWDSWHLLMDISVMGLWHILCYMQVVSHFPCCLFRLVHVSSVSFFNTTPSINHPFTSLETFMCWLSSLDEGVSVTAPNWVWAKLQEEVSSQNWIYYSPTWRNARGADIFWGIYF